MAIGTPIHDALADEFARIEAAEARDRAARLMRAAVPRFPVPEWTQAVSWNA